MTKRLPTIHHPSDIKNLSLQELEDLAVELRATITEVMSVNGGHLATNLGFIELAIGMHHVFDAPTDKILFDTSHQTYAHKLLTGRYKQFHTIRKYKGLSGFTSPDESIFDHFFAGHAGTALSLAEGLAIDRDLKGNDHFILSVLGDAAFSCGLTMEALNNLLPTTKKFIILLNDNDMYISDSIGNFNYYFRCLHNETARMNLFEKLGMEYIGPFDGHDLETVIDCLEQAKRSDKPVLLHARTVKGKGISIAEELPKKYHGVKPFDLETKEFHPIQSILTFPKVFGGFIYEKLASNHNLCVITPAMALGSGLQESLIDFPDRVIDVGIAEGHCVTLAAGIAAGREQRVVVSIYATFMQRALDNIFHDVCLQKLPITFAIDRSGIAGGDGATHNGTHHLGFLLSLPNAVITYPRNQAVLTKALEHSLSSPYPHFICYPNREARKTNINTDVKVGCGHYLQKGSQVAIISLGDLDQIAFELSTLLQSRGITPTIFDPIYLKPYDAAAMSRIAEEHDVVLSIEEHCEQTGLGSVLSRHWTENSHTSKLISIGTSGTYLEQGSLSELRREVKLDPESLMELVTGKLEEISPL